MVIYFYLHKHESTCCYSPVVNLRSRDFTVDLFWNLARLNPSFYVAEDEVPDETHILEHQDLVSRSEIEVKKQISQEGEKLTSKYKNHRAL